MTPSGFEPALDATIESSSRAPAEARRVVQRLAAVLDVGALRDAQLLVSEIVTNSIRHSGSTDPIRIRAWNRSGGLRVEVADGGFGFEADTRSVGEDAEGGRGLMILDTLADRWGVSRDARARVWFELSARPVSRGARAG
ncbi:MAG TPA: ATP-binding protein [Thermoleophilaceae bacterium]|nr:ATP-binding protein [Thermoleophilaceae bacterium]